VQIYHKIQLKAKEEGINVIGVASLASYLEKEENPFIPRDKNLKYIIVIGVKVNEIILNEIIDYPTRRYLYHYRELNRLLDHTTLKLALFLEEEGYKALPIPASVIVDWQNLKGEFSHKLAGYLAGLGWIGRSSLLIHPKYKAKLRYASLLTNAPLENALPDKLWDFGCENCNKCVIACPANAISFKEENIEFSKEVCLDKLREFAKKQAFGTQYICGICVKVCN
jgi:epoxyqueuosine reductase QueG